MATILVVFVKGPRSVLKNVAQEDVKKEVKKIKKQNRKDVKMIFVNGRLVYSMHPPKRGT